jgi:hypothetical protein
MVMAMRLADNKEGKGKGGGSKGDDDGNDGGRQQSAQWRLWQEGWQRHQGCWTSNRNGYKEGDCDGD